MKKEAQRKEREGKISYSKFGSKMELIKYNSSTDVLIKFENGYKITSQYSHFLDGEVKYPYDKSVCGIGYFGEGLYKGSTNGRTNINYNQWDNMLHRCYDPKYQKDKPTYIGCMVHEEWLNFQIFAKWHSENYFNIEGQRMCLDKDILFKGNKIYSPETCVIVPERINSLFIKNNATRGSLPIGVYFSEAVNKYQAHCNNGSGKVQLMGNYDTPLEAFVAYKIYKENIIKQVAEEYKSLIPKNIYTALINYRVEITD